MSTTRLAVAVVCPICDSAINVGCRDPRGRPVPPHAERVTKARALGVKDKGAKHRRKRSTGPRKRTAPAPGRVTIRRLDTGEIVDVVSQRSLRSRKEPKP